MLCFHSIEVKEDEENTISSYINKIKSILSNINDVVEGTSRGRTTAKINSIVSQPYTSNLRKPSIKSIKKNVLYAGAAICNDTSLKEWTCGYCKKVSNTTLISIFKDEKTEARGYIAIDNDDKAIILSFRGTTVWKNWLEDFAFMQIVDEDIDNPLSAVHFGFYYSMEAILKYYIDELKFLLKNEAYKDYKLRFVGHSFGGSIATLSAIRLQNRLDLNWNKIELFTYGQPRTGNSQFAQWLNNKPITLARSVNYADPIARLPQMSIFDYKHIGNEVFISKESSVSIKICSNELLEDPTCASGVSFLNFRNSEHNIYFDTLMELPGCD